MKLEVKEVPPVKPVKEYVLTLDEREARALISVLGKIEGERTGPRGLTTNIFHAMEFAGVPWDPEGRYFTGRMRGADEWPEEER